MNPRNKQVKLFLTSDKMEFKAELPKEIGKDTTYILKEKIHQQYVAVSNICVPNTRGPTFVKETPLQLKLYIDSGIRQL